MRVFVTGASGQLGSRVTTRLINRGDVVSGLGRSPSSAEKVAKLGATPVEGLWTQLDLLKAESAKADAVVHCAFNHEDMATEMVKICEQDRAAIQAMADGLNSNKTGASPKVFIYISGTFGSVSADEDSKKVSNPYQPRYLSEDLTFSLESEKLKTSVVRLPPIVHEDTLHHPFISLLASTAKKSGFSGYLDADNVWPSAHYDDVADLCVLAIDKAPGGKALHAVAENGISTKDLAGWIGDELGMPTTKVPKEEAMGHFGFIGMLLGMNNYTTAEKTKEWTGWSPSGPGLLADMRTRGLPEYK